MSAKPFLIANYKIGLERDLEPWLLPREAFPTLENCYVFRGRITRRNGFLDLGRLVTNVTAEALGNVIAPFNSFSATLANPDISPGSVTVTVGALTFTDGGVFGDQTGVLNTSPVTANTGTINYITGDITLTFSPALGGITAVTVDYDYYNALPVMGTRTREITTINEESLVAFDTIKANEFSNANNRFKDISFHKTTNNVFSWTGSNSDFFYTTNYYKALWATNNIRGFQNAVGTTNPASGDGIRWYDGTGWINFLPQVDATNYLMGALLIFSYRNRLVMLNTYEGSAYGTFTQYRQRARWCKNGSPFYSATVPSGIAATFFDANSWRSDITGEGGYIDAPTSEQIIGAQFFRNTLIVFFERSTWQLKYSGNETLPFYWERVAVEFGAESTFSIVPFEDAILGVGNTGFIYSDATTTRRFDYQIPDEVFKIHNGNNGPKRVHGIRDYTNQLVYWTFPDASSNPIFPTRVMVYNYLDGAREHLINGAFSIFNDSFTCFGYYQPFNDTTWADLKKTWGGTNIRWNDGQFQSDYPLIVAGNQQGFVLKNINRGSTTNDYSLIITGISAANPSVLTSTNHNLSKGTIIQITDIQGMDNVIVGEAQGTALSGTTSFSSQLAERPILASSVTITIGANVFTDDGSGAFTGGLGGTIDYASGIYTVNFTSLGADTAVTADYTTTLNGFIYRVNSTGANTFNIQQLDSNGNYIFVDTSGWNAYTAGGRIIVRNNFLIETKRFNPFLENGDQVRLQMCDYYLDASENLEFTTTVYLDENDNSSVENTSVMPNSNLLGKVWLRSFYSAIGQFAQISINFSDEQMFDTNKSDGDFTMHAMMLWMSNGGRLTYGEFF